MNGLCGVSRKVPRKSVTAPAVDAPRVRLALEGGEQLGRHRDRDGGGLLAGDAGQADGRVDPVDGLVGVPVAEQSGAEPRPLRRRADQADRTEVVEPQRRRRRGRRPRRGRGSSRARGCPAAARRARARAAPARGGRAPRRRHRPAGPGRSASRCSARESTRCRSRSWRARMRASSRPTWPTPKIATLGTTASGSSSTATSPPQHCTPCSRPGPCRERWDCRTTRGGSAGCEQRPCAPYGLGLEVAATDRAPRASRGDDHLGAGLARRVPADVGSVTRTPRLASGAERRRTACHHVVIRLPPTPRTAGRRARSRAQ